MLMEKIWIPGVGEYTIYSSGKDFLRDVLSPLGSKGEVNVTDALKSLTGEDEEHSKQCEAYISRLVQGTLATIQYIKEQLERSLEEDKKLYTDEDERTEFAVNTADVISTLEEFQKDASQHISSHEDFLSSARAICIFAYLNDRAPLLINTVGALGGNRKLRNQGGVCKMSDYLDMMASLCNIAVHTINLITYEALAGYICSQAQRGRISVGGRLYSYAEILSRLCVYRYMDKTAYHDEIKTLVETWEEKRQVQGKDLDKKFKKCFDAQYRRRNKFLKALAETGLSIPELYAKGKIESEEAQQDVWVLLPEMFDFGPEELSELKFPETKTESGEALENDSRLN